jgi:uncharacterized protein (DUF433 family)
MAKEWIMKMQFKDRKEVNFGINSGKPIIKGIRISDKFILEFIKIGWNTEKIIKSYLQLTKEDILTEIEYKL